jgi:hypothetical protein
MVTRSKPRISRQKATSKIQVPHLSPSADSGKHRILEAPDRGQVPLEAPERQLAFRAEAPDLGEGRALAEDHEFTHGRSRS